MITRQHNPAYATAPYEEIELKLKSVIHYDNAGNMRWLTDEELKNFGYVQKPQEYPRRFMDPEGKIEVLPFLPEPIIVE